MFFRTIAVQQSKRKVRTTLRSIAMVVNVLVRSFFRFHVHSSSLLDWKVIDFHTISMEIFNFKIDFKHEILSKIVQKKIENVPET